MKERRDDLDGKRTAPLGTKVSVRALIVVAVAVAALLRIMWAMHYTLTIEMEGAEYGRIAENLLNGRGYVGMYNNGTHVGFPPLFPLAIATLSYLVGNTELAERAINVACGAALVIPMFGIGMALYGQRVAIGLVALVVFHPVLVAVGASTYSEGPYLLLLMSALLCLMKWVAGLRLADGFLAGAFFGLAYLIRPESFLIVAVFAGCGLLAAAWGRSSKTLWGSVALAAAFFLVALPYVVFLFVNTGRVRLETKGPINYLAAVRINSGMSVAQAFTGVGDDMSLQGVFVRPTLDVVNQRVPSVHDYVVLLMKSAPRNLKLVVNAILNETAFGSPLLFALVVLALFRQGWNRHRILVEGIMLFTVGTMLAVLFMIPKGLLFFRYFYPLFGVLLIWAAKGADDMYDWGRTSMASIIDNHRIAELSGQLLKWGSIAAILVVSLRATPYVDQFRESQFPEWAKAGRWIGAQSPKHPWIMDYGLQVAYYAGGDFTPLPYATSDVAVRYVAKIKPDFIVLHSLSSATVPYGEEWFESGIPDRRAVLVYDDAALPSSTEPVLKQRSTVQDVIKIYRWVASPER